MGKARMQDMTWPEIEHAMKEGADTVLIMATSQEQHGHHLVEGTDFYWGAELADRVARELEGRVLIAPIIPFGPNEEMMSFPGTVSLRQETLMAILRDMCESYARHGFRNAVLLTSHEGDFEAMALAEQDFGDIGINVIGFDDIGGLVQVIQATARASGVDVLAAGAHASEFETSIMLAAYPEKVDMEKAKQGVLVDLSDHPDFFRQDLRQVTPVGIVGDARPATAEQGERYWEALTSLFVEFIKEQIGPRLSNGDR